MKIWSIFILAVFINFMALPTIATILKWELPSISQNLLEEEVKTSPTIVEKSLPKILKISDFLQFFEGIVKVKSFIAKDDSIHLSPALSIFSPPPDFS